MDSLDLVNEVEMCL